MACSGNDEIGTRTDVLADATEQSMDHRDMTTLDIARSECGDVPSYDANDLLAAETADRQFEVLDALWCQNRLGAHAFLDRSTGRELTFTEQQERTYDEISVRLNVRSGLDIEVVTYEPLSGDAIAVYFRE